VLGIWPLNFIGIILTSLTCAALLLAGLSILARRPEARTTTSSGRLSSAVFLFDRDELVDAAPDALSLLSRCAQDLSDWDKLLFLATPRFPDLKERLLSLDEEGGFSLDAEGVKNSKIEAKSWDGLTCLKIIETIPAPDFQYIDPLSLNALEDELETLRGLAEDSPQLIWNLNANHQITWANSAYLTLAEDIAGRTETDVPIWPPHQIFLRISKYLSVSLRQNEEYPCLPPTMLPTFGLMSRAHEEGQGQCILPIT